MRGLYPAGADCARRARRGLYPAVADCTRRARRGLYGPAAQMLRIRRACRGDQICNRPSGVPRPSSRHRTVSHRTAPSGGHNLFPLRPVVRGRTPPSRGIGALHASHLQGTARLPRCFASAGPAVGTRFATVRLACLILAAHVLLVAAPNRVAPHRAVWRTESIASPASRPGQDSA